MVVVCGGWARKKREGERVREEEVGECQTFGFCGTGFGFHTHNKSVTTNKSRILILFLAIS